MYLLLLLFSSLYASLHLLYSWLGS